MTYDHALSIAIDALRRQAQRLAVDANLHDLYHANHPAAIKASQKRRELLQTIDTLQAGPLAGMPAFVAGDWTDYKVCTICGGLVRSDLEDTHFQECQAWFLAQEIPATTL